jgi:hypothetical protein
MRARRRRRAAPPEDLIGELGTVAGPVGRGSNTHDDLVAIDLLERDVGRIAGRDRDGQLVVNGAVDLGAEPDLAPGFGAGLEHPEPEALPS